jgi:thioredoxin-related protein
MAYLAGQGVVLETKDPTSSTLDHQATGPYQGPQLRGQNQEKATQMATVTSPGCEPCRRMKSITIPSLQLQGYNVTSIDYREWEGPKVSLTPTLFYMDAEGNIIYKEVGFRTPRQVKKYLEKP